MSQLLDSWKAWAVADAERRGLHGLKPILEGLAAATSRLRAIDWQPNRPDRPVGPVGTVQPAQPARPARPARPDNV
jgi:hypothetical protein